jgi:DNA-binding transcriptional LysR family regulator
MIYNLPMDLKQLRALLAIAETGSVTRAADILHIVQPAISRQLKLLEEELGVALFERERHGMVLTPPGRLFVERASRALQELDAAKEEISPARSRCRAQSWSASSQAPQTSWSAVS